MGFISNGTTILDNGAFSVGLGDLFLLSTQTASASASISFTTEIDSTYDAYQFEIINCHPETDQVNIQFNLSTDGGANYNVTKTTTFFTAYNDEDDTSADLVSLTFSLGLAQSTAFQSLTTEIGNDADQSVSATLTLFNPSSTTFVKHFIATVNEYSFDNFSINNFVAGYGNTTSAVNAIQFKMLSGNFDGIIKMYGIKGS